MEASVFVNSLSKKDREDLKMEVIKGMKKDNAKFALKCMAYLLGVKVYKEYLDIMLRSCVISL